MALVALLGKPLVDNNSRMEDEKLIDEVCKRTGIYDRSDPRHANKEYLATAWGEIAEVLNSTVDDVKKKWTNYRDYFRRQLKMHASERSRRKKWILFDRMSFLIPYLKFWGNKSNGDESGSDNPDLSLDCVSVDSESQLDEDYEPGQTLRKRGKLPSTKSRRGVKRKFEEPPEESLEFTNPTPDEDSELEDEDDHFFKSCLPTVKFLSSEDKLEFRIRVQQLLLNLVRRQQYSALPHHIEEAAKSRARESQSMLVPENLSECRGHNLSGSSHYDE